MRKHTQQQRMTSTTSGFTLVETLVAVLMLALVLSTVTALLVTSVRATTLSSDRFLGAKLAQEGIELIKAKRTANIDNGDFWLSNLVGVWEPDSTQDSARNPGNSYDVGDPANPRVLCVRTVPAAQAGKYWYQCNGVGNSRPLPGNFTRQVSVVQLNAYSASVSSTISWGDGAHTFTVSTVLYEII